MEFDTQVRGVACVCRVEHYSPGSTHAIHGASEVAPVEEEFEFILLDEYDNPLEDLQALMTWWDECLLCQDFKANRVESA